MNEEEYQILQKTEAFLVHLIASTEMLETHMPASLLSDARRLYASVAPAHRERGKKKPAAPLFPTRGEVSIQRRVRREVGD